MPKKTAGADTPVPGATALAWEREIFQNFCGRQWQVRAARAVRAGWLSSGSSNW